MELNNKKVQIDPKLFTQKEIKLFNEIKDFKTSNSILNFYKTKVKSNLNETKKTATKKLIRNIMLANEGKIDVNKPHIRIYHYGKLNILTNFKKKKIAWLNNNKECNSYFSIDKVKKEHLHKVLNIHN